MKLQHNVILFYWISFLKSCLFLLPIWYFFFTNYLNFGIADAILINTFGGLSIFLFEIHSGSWADRFGRKRVYFIGLLLCIIGFLFYLFSTSISLFLLSSFLLGAGYAFTSGNLEALIHDNFEERGMQENYDTVLGNQYIIQFLGRAISSLCAGYLFLYNELYPAIASILCYMIAVLLLFFIKSTKQKLSNEKTNFIHIKKTLLFLYERKKMLYMVIFGGLLLSGLANIYWYTYQPYLEYIGVNIKDIGVTYFFISLFSAAGSYILKKIQNKVPSFTILHSLFLLLVIVSFMFYVFNNIFGLIPIIILSILFGFIMILGNTYLIKYSPKDCKSTILSIFGLSASLGAFIFGTTTGYMVELFTIEKVYSFLPFIILFISLLGLVFYKKITKELNQSNF